MENDLFSANISLVEKIVNRLDYGYVDRDDLLQAGLMGLYAATLNYDNSKNDAFIPYAMIYITSEIKKELRENKLVRMSKGFIKIIRMIKESNGDLSIDEIAKGMQTSKENVVLALDYKDRMVSLNKTDEDGNELLDIVSSNSPDFKLSDLLFGLSVDERRVILLKYYKGYSQQAIADTLKYSQSKVSRIEANALMMIRKNNFVS